MFFLTNRVFEEDSLTVESQLEQHHLELLLSKFREDTRKHSASTCDNKVEHVFKLDKASFSNIIVNLLSPVNGSQFSKDILTSSACNLFEKVCLRLFPLKS